MAERSVSVPMTLSDLERRDTRRQIFQADLLNSTHTVWPRMTKFGTRRGVFIGVSHAPIAGAGSQRCPIWGVLFYLFVHPLLQNYQIWRGNSTWGGACIFASATPPISRERSQYAAVQLGYVQHCALKIDVPPMNQTADIRHWTNDEF